MQYMVFVVSVVIGGWMGYPVSGFIIGLALWYGIVKIQGKPSAENEQLKAEIADLQRRVHALELQLSRPSENVLPTAQEEDPHPSAIPDAMPMPSAAEPALEAAAAVFPADAANETVQPQAARISRLQQMRLQAEEAAAVENRPSESDSADRFQTASFVEAEQGQAADQPAYYAPMPSEKEAATDGGGSLLTRLTGGNLLLKTGIVVLFLGLAFLLRYASERVHIPIGLRYLSVAGGGLAAVVAGWKLQSRRREYGLILQGFGVAVMYLTSLAALKLHPLLPAPAVFAAMVVLVAAMAVMAVRQDAQIMAQAAVIGGMAAPILVSDGSGNYLVLFSYLALLNTGIAAIARFKSWRPLNLTGFVCTFCIALFWGLKSYTPGHFSTTEPFLIYHWLLYTLIACLFARRRLSEGGGDALPPLADNALLGDIIGHIAKHGIRVHILDHTLLFGTMAAAFALQCGLTAHLTHGSGWSAVLFAAVYGAGGTGAARQFGVGGVAAGVYRLRFVVCHGGRTAVFQSRRHGFIVVAGSGAAVLFRPARTAAAPAFCRFVGLSLGGGVSVGRLQPGCRYAFVRLLGGHFVRSGGWRPALCLLAQMAFRRFCRVGTRFSDGLFGFRRTLCFAAADAVVVRRWKVVGCLLRFSLTVGGVPIPKKAAGIYCRRAVVRPDLDFLQHQYVGRSAQ